MDKKEKTVIWLDIKKDLELKIVDGTYKSGKKVPSISEVTEIYSCGDCTAQKVLESLCQENILIKKRGVGYFVKPLCQEKLRTKYMKTLEKDMEDMVSKAISLGVSKDSLNELYQRTQKNGYL